MAARILWAPVISCFFLLENPHAHKIPLFFWGGRGGVKCQSYFYGRGGFSYSVNAKRIDYNAPLLVFPGLCAPGMALLKRLVAPRAIFCFNGKGF